MRWIFGLSVAIKQSVIPENYVTGALNRILDAAVKLAQDGEEKTETVSVHDLRLTASTLLYEAGFNSDWIEKYLTHEQRGASRVQ